MSFVIAAPELLSAAAADLENIRSTISGASTAAAGSTTALLPAAEDEVSAAIAALFGAHGTAFQALSAQAAAFHEEFVRVLNAGAGAYLSTELANAQQNLLNLKAVNAPVQGLLGHSAAASSLAAARMAALPLLGGGGHGINGVVAALHNGSAVSLLSGQIGAAPQSISGGIAGLPTGLTGLQHALAPGLLAPAASHGLASIAGPYETLIANTAANLGTLARAIAANPAPFLRQFLINQIGYAQRILMDLVHFIEDPVAVIQAAIHALLNFDPVPFIDAIFAQAHVVATSLVSAAHDFTLGLAAFPAAIQSAVQDLLAGNLAGAVSHIGQAFLGLFVSGIHITEMGDPLTPPGLEISITPTGTLADLLPILRVPGNLAHDFAALLPPGSIPADIANNVGNVFGTLTNTSINLTALLSLSPFGVTLTGEFGLPVALLIDAAGAPVDTARALASTATMFVHEVQTGDLAGAIGTVIDAPAVVTNAFLNGETTIPLSIPIPDFSEEIPPIPIFGGGTLTFANGVADVNIPLDGILVPVTPATVTLTGTASGTGSILSSSNVLAALINSLVPLNANVGGTPISGLATGLLVFAPEQLAEAIGA